MTRDGRLRVAPVRAWPLALVLWPCLAHAQAPPARVTVVAAVGVFRPAEQVFRDTYGGAEPAWLVQADVRVAGPVGVFGGVRRLSREGRTVTETASDLAFDTTIEITSVRFGASAGARVGPVRVTGRFGADYNTGDEEWPGLEMSTSFDAWGWLAQGSVRVPVWRNLAAVGLMELTRVSVETDAFTDPMQVGGLTLAAGVAVGF